MIEKIIINQFVAIIELLVIYELSKRFRFGDIAKKSIGVITVVLYLIFSAVATVFINNPIMLITINSIILFDFTYIYKMKLNKRIVSILMYIVISMSFELLVTLTVGAINNISPVMIQDDIELYLLCGIISKFLLYCTVKTMLMLVKPVANGINIWHSSLSLLMPIASIVVLIILSFVVYKANGITEKIMVLSSAVLLIAANISALITFDSIAKREGKIHNQEKEIINLETEINHYNLLISSQIESNREIHDLKHKMFTIKEYMHNNDDKAFDVVNQICESMLSKQIVNYVGLDDINALLNVKSNLAARHGIKLNITAFIFSSIEINSMDICVILGNILCNSIEACENLTAERKEISLALKMQGNYLAIKCTNPTSNENVEIGKSTKDNTSLNHGYGLQKINELSTKYDGIMNFKVEKGQFLMAILLKNCISHPLECSSRKNIEKRNKKC